MAPALRLAALPSTIRLLSHKKNSGFHPLCIMNFVFVCSVLELFGGLEMHGEGGLAVELVNSGGVELRAGGVGGSF